MSNVVALVTFSLVILLGPCYCEVLGEEIALSSSSSSLSSSSLSASSASSGSSFTSLTDFCGISYGFSGYDLTGLRGRMLHTQDRAGVFDFYLNICGVVNATDECAKQNAMVCRVAPDNSSYPIAYLHEKPSWMSLGNGIQLTVYGASNPPECVSNTKTSYPPSARNTVIQVLCSGSYLRAPSIRTVTQNSDTCGYTITMYHALGCPLSYTQPFPPPTPATLYYSISESGPSKLTIAAISSCVTLAAVILLKILGYFIRRCYQQREFKLFRFGWPKSRSQQLEGSAGLLAVPLMPVSAPASFSETDSSSPLV